MAGAAAHPAVVPAMAAARYRAQLFEPSKRSRPDYFRALCRGEHQRGNARQHSPRRRRAGAALHGAHARAGSSGSAQASDCCPGHFSSSSPAKFSLFRRSSKWSRSPKRTIPAISSSRRHCGSWRSRSSRRRSSTFCVRCQRTTSDGVDRPCASDPGRRRHHIDRPARRIRADRGCQPRRGARSPDRHNSVFVAVGAAWSADQSVRQRPAASVAALRDHGSAARPPAGG